ncbi:helix-turn-helix transcriptional regulator [Pedobacter riviphilus]|uniref:Helix-turn-helix transcriptional regulator n=1 Tax=Pedobacter riviphilus TaxID=2766984 RepID=A0ABX6TK90_9SPHI|nr:helix-turn-helix transcriptional regulator [Pedobacter riviphilus]QNR85883.1 helix-turn-helix transcriptional regulator [Pedobacter riviphilus]
MEELKKEEILKLFGTHLKNIRNEKKISLRVLEQLSNIDYSQIHRIEKGETAPSLVTLLSLAKGLGIDPKELLDFLN